ncbi:MAG: FadR/GntR family transcriptional regulator [Pseudomonadota bacterium]
MTGNESEDWLRPIYQTKLYIDVIRVIRDQIVSGRINPGDYLPSGRELSEKLKVSRAVVREAMRVLELIGVAQVRSGGTTALINKQNRLILLESIDTLLSNQLNMLTDLLEIRYLIDPILTRLAAERADKEDIDLLKGAIQEMEADIDAGRSGSQGSMNFHYFIARSTHNKVAMRIMSIIIGISAEISALSFRTPGRPRISLSQHKALLDAVSARDANRAESAMREHFLTLKTDISQVLKKTKSEETENV